MMRKLPLIKSVMTPFPYSIEISTLLSDAYVYMQKHDIHHLPVTDGGILAGILTERDVFNNQNATASEINLGKPWIFDLNERLDNVLSEMAEQHIDTALVTRHDKLVGIFTVTDACKQFANYLREEFAPPGGDEAA